MKTSMIVLFMFCVLHLSSTIINIPADQPTIQAGINVTVDGDTVLVQPGTYYENINFFGKNIVLTSNFITTQDTFYINETIINGSLISNVVIFENGETSLAMLNGFTISSGMAYGGYGGGGGGIICKDYSHPVISNNIITNCRSELDGGGIFCFNFSNPEIVNNLICGNIALLGGAISCWQHSNPSINGNRIINNFASYSGGGLYLGEADNGIQVIDNLIQNNSSLSVGGGIFSFASNPLISNNIIIFNHSDTYGGGIYNGSTLSAFIINNKIERNSADLYGGGIYSSYECNPEIIGNVICNNSSEYGGGIALRNDCNSPITNCTISNNNAISLGGGIFLQNSSSPNIVNTILWENSALLDGNEIYLFTDDCDPDFLFCDIQGGIEAFGLFYNTSYTGIYENNIETDPLFIEIGEFPYSLFVDSPCIDVGIPDTTGLNLPQYDLTGNPRFNNNRIDIGAYEWQGTPVEDEELVVMNWELSNYPNPFNPSTTIEFSIPEECKIELSIYNIKGQKIKSHLSDQISAGEHSIIWNGEDDLGKKVSSGVYLYNLIVNGKTEAVRKCLLLK